MPRIYEPPAQTGAEPGLMAGGPVRTRRPQYGQRFSQLPAGGVTPESMVNEQIQTGRQEIQQRFNLAWDEINRSARFIGKTKAGRMRQELHVKAKQEMLQFNQKAQQQMAGLNSINRLAEQGLIYNADELKARMVFGSDVARSMYPPSKSVEQEWSALQIPLNKIESRLADFGREKKRIKKWYLGEKKEPLVPGKLEILDENELYTDDKGVVRQGIWRTATQQEIAEHRMLVVEQDRIKRKQAEIFGRSDVRQRIAQPGTRGGTFSDKVTESVRPQPTQRSAPKVIRQRNRTTGQKRISYDGGKTWQMTG